MNNQFSDIPKVIHYCWLSNDTMPTKLTKCVESWKKYCPDYQIINWNFERLGDDCPDWVKEAYDNKKYAFAADWVRAYALYNYGGIYLDSDVEVIKSFDNLMTNDYFLSYQACNDDQSIEAAIMGSRKGFNLFKLLLDYYKDRHFIKDDGSLDTRELPYIMRDIINNNFKPIEIDDPSKIINCNESELYILTADYFSPKSLIDGKIRLTKNTYAIHHFSGSWLSKKEKLYKKTLDIFGYKIAHCISKTIKYFFR